MNVETAFKKVKDNIDRLLDKSLTDMIRGIRNNKENEIKYISQCLDEIKIELKQDNMSVKANAILKLIYLQMLGYNMNWAAFNVIEVMSSTRFTYKRIGYLAASQSFNNKIDVLMLATNLIKKDINNSSQYEAALALNGLSCFITTDLARDLSMDITSLMSSTKPYIRKRAILMMYKIFINYPESLEIAFPKMREKLEDQDQSVQSAVVNVICEMARRNPKNYLSLAPIFFKLMTTSTNNWMLIKIIKLFGTLTPIEPRLGKKLLEPLTNLIHSTSAMSLLYECINTLLAVLVSISSGKPDHSASIQLCLQKLRILIEDNDQNLKYLGLLAMSKILKTYPKNVQAHKDIVLKCLEDKDDSIRLRALHLLYGMVNKKTLMDIVKTLLTHLCTTEAPQSYKDDLLSNIIVVCSQNNYQYITDFEWYLDVLIEFTKLDTPKNIPFLATQLLDVTIRVPTLRKYSVQQMEKLLDNSHLFSTKGPHKRMSELLYVAAYISGEYSQFLEFPETTLRNMIDPLRLLGLSYNVQSVCIFNALKIYTRILSKSQTNSDKILSNIGSKCNKEHILQLSRDLSNRLNHFIQSNSVEVQERAILARQYVDFILTKLTVENALATDGFISQDQQEILSLFSGDLNPVAPKAQSKVPIPNGLDLDASINIDFERSLNSHRYNADLGMSDLAFSAANGPLAGNSNTIKNNLSLTFTSSSSQPSSEEIDQIEKNIGLGADTRLKKKKEKMKNKQMATSTENQEKIAEKEIRRVRKARLDEQASNPHYLKSKPMSAGKVPHQPNDFRMSPSKRRNKSKENRNNSHSQLNLEKLLIAGKNTSAPNDANAIKSNSLNQADYDYYKNMGEMTYKHNESSKMVEHRVEILDYEVPEEETGSYSNLHKHSSKRDKKGKTPQSYAHKSNSPDELLLIDEGINGVTLKLDNYVPPDEVIKVDDDFNFWLSPAALPNQAISISSKSNDVEYTSLKSMLPYEPFASDNNIIAFYQSAYENPCSPFQQALHSRPKKFRVRLKFQLNVKNLNASRKGVSHCLKTFELSLRCTNDQKLNHSKAAFEIVTPPYMVQHQPPHPFSNDLNGLDDTLTALKIPKSNSSNKTKDNNTTNDFYLKIPNNFVLQAGSDAPDSLELEMVYQQCTHPARGQGISALNSTDNFSHINDGDNSFINGTGTSTPELQSSDIYNELPQLIIKGGLSYILVQNDDSESLKLDFKLRIPSYEFLSPIPIESNNYENLIGNLPYEETCKIGVKNQHSSSSEKTFQRFTQILTKHLHFYTVDQTGNHEHAKALAASFYAKTIWGQDVCLYAKLSKSSKPIGISELQNGPNNNLVIKFTVKCQNEPILAQLIRDMKPYLKNHMTA